MVLPVTVRMTENEIARALFATEPRIRDELVPWIMAERRASLTDALELAWEREKETRATCEARAAFMAGRDLGEPADPPGPKMVAFCWTMAMGSRPAEPKPTLNWVVNNVTGATMGSIGITNDDIARMSCADFLALPRDRAQHLANLATGEALTTLAHHVGLMRMMLLGSAGIESDANLRYRVIDCLQTMGPPVPRLRTHKEIVNMSRNDLRAMSPEERFATLEVATGEALDTFAYCMGLTRPRDASDDAFREHIRRTVEERKRAMTGGT